MSDQKQSPEGKVHEPAFSKVPPDLTHNLTITDGAVRLYAHMYWQFWKNGGNDYEGQTSMANAMGVSEVTISKRIHELEFNDWIVVIELERSRESGNYLTPFYHVFVEQKDAIAFRKTYKCQPNETIRPKPATTREKKSRKGKGGKPTNILKYNASKADSPSDEANRTNSSLDGDRTNSSWDGGTNLNKDGGTNSSWDELKTPALDSHALDSNTPHTPAPNGLGSASTPPSKVEGLQDFYNRITEGETPVTNTLEEKSPPTASVATPPPPSSATPPSLDKLDMTHLRDVVANKWCGFVSPKYRENAGDKFNKTINTVIDIVVDTFPDATDDKHAWVALEFCTYWSTKTKNGQKLALPKYKDTFGDAWRTWLMEHPEIMAAMGAQLVSVVDPKLAGGFKPLDQYTPEAKAYLAKVQNEMRESRFGKTFESTSITNPFKGGAK